MWGTNYNDAFKESESVHHPNQRYDPVYFNNCDRYDTIPSVLIIDSQYRDNPSSTTPSDYTVTLINKYSDVTSLELVYAGIPNSNYNITTNNNRLDIMPIGELTKIFSWSGGTDATLVGDTVYTFSSLSGGVRPSVAGTDDNTITVTRNSSGIVTAITVQDGGVNWIPGESVTLSTTDTTPNLAQALTFTVTETAVQTIEISAGLYSSTALTSALDAQLANINVVAVSGEDLTGDINTDADIGYPLDNYIMTSTGPSAFPFGVKVVSSGVNYVDGTMAQLLGFKPANNYSTSVSGDYKLVSDYPVMLEMDHYIAMFIEGMERCDGNNTNVHGAFCIVPLDAQQENFGLFKDSNNIDNDKFVYYFHQPHKLSKLHITFRDWQGNLYDFNGLNHTLIFKIETAVSRRKFSTDV